MTWILSSDSHRKALEEIQQTASDRATALVGATLVERDLLNAIEARLVDDSDVVKKLFKPAGPIGNFGTKVELGYLLSIYDKSARDDLNQFVTIRNRFAHSIEPLKFDSREIKKLCASLTIVDATEYPKVPGKGLPDDLRSPPHLSQNAAPRDRFIQAIRLFIILFWERSHDYVMGADSNHRWRMVGARAHT